MDYMYKAPNRNKPIFLQIRSAPDSDLRAALTALCSEDTTVAARAKAALEKLDRFRRESRPTSASADAGTDAADGGGDGGARSGSASAAGPAVNLGEMGKEEEKGKDIAKVFLCGACGEAFSDETNKRFACCYHSGEIEDDVDGDFWADHDEDLHGDIDTEENRNLYPESFIWSCCDRQGNAKGCRRGRHNAYARKARYGRGRDSDPESDADSVDARQYVDSGNGESMSSSEDDSDSDSDI